MWRNYMTVGIRALTKNRTYAFINIVGLAIGLAACLMLLVYVRYETTYDSWLPNAENTYQFQTHYRNPQTGEQGRLQMTSYHTDIAAQFEAMAAVHRRHVQAPFPAWTAIDVDRLVPEGGITEIKIVARRRSAPAAAAPAAG